MMINAKADFGRLLAGLLVTFVLIAASTSIALSAEAEPASAEAVAPAWPGLEEVAPLATDLASRAAEAEQLITRADQSTQLQPQVEALGVELDALEKSISGWDQVQEWQISRLLEVRSNYLQLQRKQLALQEKFSEPLKSLESLHQDWLKDQQFWNDWQSSLRETWQESVKQARIKAPKEAFERSQNVIQGVIAEATRATNRLLNTQQVFSAQQELVASRIAYLDGAMDELRNETFRRNAHSLFNPDFYRQFSWDLFTNIVANARSTFRIPTGFLKTQGWIAVLQCLAAVGIGSLLSARKKRKTPMTEELSFLFKNPWAGGVFLGILLFSAFYTNEPPLWRWLLIVPTVVSATFLIVSIYRRVLVRRIIRALAVIYLLSETLALIGIPRPVQQVYLLILCLFVIATCIKLANLAAARQRESSSELAMALYFGAILGTAGLLGELTGFATFSANLVEASLGTIILALATHMAIRLSDGVIASFMQQDWVRSQRFVKRLGVETTRRLQNLMRIFLLANAFVYLFVIWKVFDHQKDALSELLAWQFTVGEFSVTLQMLVLLLLVLYLTNLVSWIVQALADAHFMTPRKMEFGVKTALKRLLHYALFTIGFFVAVSMAGLDLQKFTIFAGALGVGIGFGLQNIVNNFVSGLILLFERPVKVGDTINIDDQWGTITRIGLRSTVVETLDQAEIIVPNSDLIAQKVVNWTLTTSVSRIVLPVGVAYGSRLEKVLEILDRVAREHADILNTPEPSAIFTGFGNSSIDFELRVWVGDISKRLKVKSDLGQALDNAFRKEGITIPFPQMDLHLKSVEKDLRPLFDQSGQDRSG